MKSLGDNVVYKIGIVVDVNDPLKLGRARVRLIGIYDEEVPVEHLPWALCVYPIGLKAIAPPLLGSSVLCWIVDDGFQQIIIVGELPGVKDGTTPDTPAIARNGDDIGESIVASKSENRLEGDITEPDSLSTYNALYPKNYVINNGNHFIELDNTPGFERVHIYHESGSYIEMTAEGNINMKSVNDLYVINNGTRYESIGGMEQKIVGSEYKITAPMVTIQGTLQVSTAPSGTFTADGSTVTVVGGIITNIA